MTHTEIETKDDHEHSHNASTDNDTSDQAASAMHNDGTPFDFLEMYILMRRTLMLIMMARTNHISAMSEDDLSSSEEESNLEDLEDEFVGELKDQVLQVAILDQMNKGQKSLEKLSRLFL